MSESWKSIQYNTTRGGSITNNSCKQQWHLGQESDLG